MQTPLQLSWRHLRVDEAVVAQVREEVERLGRYSSRITGCAVTLEAPSHHHRRSGAQYRVRIELTVPRARLVVARNPPKTAAHADLDATVRAAFREARRKLQDHVRRLDARVKAHRPPALAEVARLLPEQGHGFLTTEDGREIYFHERSVLRAGFAGLRVGSAVRFVEEAGEEGPQASTVRPVAARRRVLVGAAARPEPLPRPDLASSPLCDLLARRRSRREFGRRQLLPAELGALLWAGQGITSPEGGRAAPSAGALYPVTLSVVDALGVWRYQPGAHALAPAVLGDRRRRLAAATEQDEVAQAPLTVAVTARPDVLAGRYGARAERYATLEAGHVAQSLLLMATALGLAAVPIAAFDDGKVRAALALGADDLPLYLVPVGGLVGVEG